MKNINVLNFKEIEQLKGLSIYEDIKTIVEEKQYLDNHDDRVKVLNKDFDVLIITRGKNNKDNINVCPGFLRNHFCLNPIVIMDEKPELMRASVGGTIRMASTIDGLVERALDYNETVLFGAVVDTIITFESL